MRTKGKFTKYDPDTGEILGQMICSLRSAEANGPFVKGHWDKIDYIIKDGVPVKRETEESDKLRVEKAKNGLKAKVISLLKDSDWTQLPDVPLTKEQKAAWKKYRKQLRDLPNTVSDPHKVRWPEKPA